MGSGRIDLARTSHEACASDAPRQVRRRRARKRRRRGVGTWDSGQGRLVGSAPEQGPECRIFVGHVTNVSRLKSADQLEYAGWGHRDEW